MMSRKIRKESSGQIDSSGRVHKSKSQPDDLIRFSFKLFSNDQPKFCCGSITDTGKYLPVLLERLREVSTYSVKEFRTKKTSALRNHPHDWNRTTEPNGYSHLGAQLQACEPWQFCLSANEYGRIHGLLIDEVFYVVWLDPLHALYE